MVNFGKALTGMIEEKIARNLCKLFAETKVCYKFARSNARTCILKIYIFGLSLVVAHGVIGNTAGFGPVVLGSSPSGPTKKIPVMLGFFIQSSVAYKVLIIVYLRH